MNTAAKKKPLDINDAIRLLDLLADPANWTENYKAGKYQWSPVLIAADNDPSEIAKQILEIVRNI